MESKREVSTELTAVLLATLRGSADFRNAVLAGSDVGKYAADHAVRFLYDNRAVDSKSPSSILALADQSSPILVRTFECICCFQAAKIWMEKEGPYGRFFGTVDEQRHAYRVVELLERAISLDPTFREAQKTLADFLACSVRMTTMSNLSRKHQEFLLTRELRSLEQLVENFPDELEASRTLIEMLLSRESLDRAGYFIAAMLEQTVTDPTALALPWRWHLLQASCYARRDKQLSAAWDSLQAAETLWPDWLSRDFLQYLHAAAAHREGAELCYPVVSWGTWDELGQSAPEQVMMIMALQWMHVPGDLLARARAKLSEQIKDPSGLPDRDLYRAGALFWDMARASLQCPCYQALASQFGKIVYRRGAAMPTVDPDFADTMSWAASHRFWAKGSAPPLWFRPYTSQSPRIAAACIEYYVRYAQYFISRTLGEITLLAEHLPQESDPFYRYRYQHLVDRAMELARLYPPDGDHTTPYG